MLNRLSCMLRGKDHHQPPTGGVDHWLAIAGLLLGSLVAVISASRYGSLVLIGSCIAVTCGVYLLLEKSEIREHVGYNKRIAKVLSIVFFSFLSVALMYSPDPQIGRLGVEFYLAIAAAYAVVTAKILLLGNGAGRSGLLWTLLQLILVSLVFRIVVYGQFPSVLGSDPWVNLAMVKDMMQTGGIPGEFVYANVPMFPLGELGVQLVTGLSYKSSLFLSGGIIELGTLVLLFAVGREVTNARTALLACLLFSFYPSFIGFGTHSIIAMSIGITMVCLLLLLLTMPASVHPTRIKALILLCLSFLVMTHVIASIIALFLVASFFVARMMKDRKTTVASPNPASSSLLVLSIVLLIGYWMWASGFLGYIVESLEYAFQVAQGDFVAPVAHPERFSSLELLLDQIIYLATTSFLVLSILVLSRKTNRRGKWGVILFVAAGMVMMELANRTGFDAILPDRWPPFIFMGTAILFAFSLIHVSERAGNLGRSALVALVAVICISMILSPTANVDSPVVNSAFRYGFQLSEMKGSDFASEASTGQITVDLQLDFYFKHGLRVDVDSYGPSYFDGSRISPTGLMLVRNYCLDHYFLVDLGISNKTVGYSSAELIEGSAFNRTVIHETAVIYSSPTLTIHTI